MPICTRLTAAAAVLPVWLIETKQSVPLHTGRPLSSFARRTPLSKSCCSVQPSSSPRARQARRCPKALTSLAVPCGRERTAAKQRMTELEDQLFSLRAQALTDRGDLLLLEPPTRPDGARKLADAAAKASGGLAAVFAGAESSYVYALVQADGADISPLVKRLNAALSGRGGGRNGFAQGSVQADRTAIYDFFRKEGIECPTC